MNQERYSLRRSLLEAIDESPLNINQVAVKAGVNNGQLYRFVEGHDLRLETVDKIIEVTGLKLPTIKLLPDLASIYNSLKSSIGNAEKSISIINSKSRSRDYLSTLRNKLLEQPIQYNHLLIGNKISHGIHSNLEDAIERPNTRIRKTNFMYPQLAIIDNRECILTLPGKHPEQSIGLWHQGSQYVKEFVDYFDGLFQYAETEIKTKNQLKDLCELDH